MRKFFLLMGVILLTLMAACGDPASPAQPPAQDSPVATFDDRTVATQPSSTLPSPTHTAAPTRNPAILEIESYLSDLGKKDAFSGVVLIAQHGDPVLLEAYGFADRRQVIQNQTDTKFNLGSMDKMFTAVAILQLAEQGKLSLEETISTYLQDYPDTEIANSVTIHQLLTHTGGLGNYFDSPKYMETFNQIRTLQDYLDLFAGTPLQFKPGSQFGYSNSGFIVLGLIIEAVSGESYYEYILENIFVPAEMQDTACYELDAGTANLAKGYTTIDWDGKDTGEITDNEFALPMRGGSAGGGYSTAPDLLKFSNALMNNQLLSPQSTSLLLEGKVRINDKVQFAYGFMDRIVNGHRTVGHGGGFPGICSMLAIYPELDLTIVILTNTDNSCIVANDFIVSKLIN